jgi:hypothetical protein
VVQAEVVRATVSGVPEEHLSMAEPVGLGQPMAPQETPERPPVAVEAHKAQTPDLLALEQMDAWRFGCGDEEIRDHRRE